jgi:predicted ester cyclase
MILMQRWFKEVWNEGREAAIDEMSHFETQGHGLPGKDGKKTDGMAEFKVFYRSFQSALSEIHVEVLDTVTEGDKTVARCHVTAKHTGQGLGKPPKGNPLSFSGMTMVRIQDGKIAEAWNNYDFLTMFQQME